MAERKEYSTSFLQPLIIKSSLREVMHKILQAGTCNDAREKKVTLVNFMTSTVFHSKLLMSQRCVGTRHVYTKPDKLTYLVL